MAMLCCLIAQWQFGPQRQPLQEALISGLGLDALSLAWLAVVQLMVFFNSGLQCIMKTCLSKYVENFTSKKLQKKNQIKTSDIFHISAQNIDCWYSLELPQRGGSNEYPQSIF